MGTIAEWGRIRKEIKKDFQKKGITYCEINLPGCLSGSFLSFAHRHKRIFYDLHENKGKGLLGSFNQVILACQNCHDKIETDKLLSEEVFEALRGPEII